MLTAVLQQRHSVWQAEMDSDCEYEDSGEEDSYDYTGEESNPEEVAEERCRFDWQDEELHNQDRGELSPVVCRGQD